MHRRTIRILRRGLAATFACLVAAICIAPDPLAASRRDGGRSARAVTADMAFAAEMAEGGLWREALYRWERALVDRPDDPRVMNNIAVACEALGQFDRARALYAQASTLARDREIRSNRQLFERARSRRAESAPGAPAPSSPPPATTGPAPSSPTASSSAPQVR